MINNGGWRFRTVPDRKRARPPRGDRALWLGLEVVLHRELQLSRTRADRRCLFGNVSEVSGVDIAKRVAEVGAVEDVISIRPEVNLLLMPDGEVLGNRRTIRLEARCALRGWASCTEGSVTRLTVGAESIIESVAKFV